MRNRNEINSVEKLNTEDNKKIIVRQEKVSQYKMYIQKIVKVAKYELSEKLQDKIEKLLDMDLKNDKIFEGEYDILNEFLEQIIMELKEDLTQNVEQSQNSESNLGEQKLNTNHLDKEGDER